jgi:hypothetical protein
MSGSGSLPERQEFFRGVTKPQDSFQDRASALLMAGRGWFCDGRLSAEEASKSTVVSDRPGGEAALSDPIALYSRKIANTAATEQFTTEPASGNSCLCGVR